MGRRGGVSSTRTWPRSPRPTSTTDDFARLLPYFQGSRPPADGAGPAWFQPPSEGLEYLLGAWLTSNDRDQFTDVMTDQIGAETAADDLSNGVMLEAVAAAGLAKVEHPTDDQIQWWARRVYWANHAMSGRIGDLIRLQRPELVPTIDDLLAQAVLHSDRSILTAPQVGLPGRTVATATQATQGGLPEPVRQAWGVAIGLFPPPDLAPPPPPETVVQARPRFQYNVSKPVATPPEDDDYHMPVFDYHGGH